MPNSAAATRSTAACEGAVRTQQPLVALEAVEQGGFFRRMWDGIRLFFRGLFG